jgi:hypothetical protein
MAVARDVAVQLFAAHRAAHTVDENATGVLHPLFRMRLRVQQTVEIKVFFLFLLDD